MLSELLGAGSTARLAMPVRSGTTRALLAAPIWGTYEIKAAWQKEWTHKLRCGFLLSYQWGDGPHGPIPVLQNIFGEVNLGNRRRSPHTPSLQMPICFSQSFHPSARTGKSYQPSLSLPCPQFLLLALKYWALLQSKVRTEYVFLCSWRGQILPCTLRNLELDLDQAITK